MVTLTLPIPQTFFQATWVGIGIIFARSFGKDGDYKIQQSAWFKQRSPLEKWIIKFLLDFTHHWFIGALLMIYFPQYPEVYWFSFGVMLDDAPDIPPRIKKLFKYVWD